MKFWSHGKNNNAKRVLGAPVKVKLKDTAWMDGKFSEMETVNIASKHFFGNFLYHKCPVSSTKSLTSTRNLSAQILCYIHDLKYLKYFLKKCL